ncbi:MAG: ATP-binding protein [Planctomycetota bacterium]
MKKTKLEILLVEDDDAHIELIRRSFQSQESGLSLTALNNLQDAKNYLKKSTPDLVITDYLLPDGKGTDLLELEGEKERLPYPVIVMTGYGSEKIAVDAMKSGALDYIIKSREIFADMPHICERALRAWNHIVKRKQAEDELKYQKEFSESLINSSVDGILAFDLHFCITIWNPGMERITGMSKADVVGKCAFEALPFLKEIGEDVFFFDTIAGKTVTSKDRHYSIPKAGKQGFFDGHYSPLLNVAGEIIGAVAIIIDTTEQKNKDRLMLLKSRQAQMGEMLSMIAHQWRQPLTAVSVITGKMKNRLLLKKLAKKELVASLEKIQNYIQFLSQTIDDFRNLFKPNKFPEPTAIESVVEKSLFIIGKQFETHTIKLECVYEYKKELKTYHNELIQVFLNLMQNTVDAVIRRQITHPEVRIHEYQRDDYIVVEISDNAGGLPDTIIENVFLPYYSTNDARFGTGLGLYICRQIIENLCKGEIAVENVENGAKFTIKLPLTT